MLLYFTFLMLAVFICFLSAIAYMRHRRRKQNKKNSQPPKNSLYGLELELIQAMKNEDFSQSMMIIKEIENLDSNNELIKKLKPKVLEKFQNENIDSSRQTKSS